MSEAAYLELLNKVMTFGTDSMDRTGVGTRALFGEQLRFNMASGFPLMTTKKVYWKALAHEMIWFLSGSSNIEYLVKNKVSIWTDWPLRHYCQRNPPISKDKFEHYIVSDPEFAENWGDLGPVYGKQWRAWRANGKTYDQIAIARDTLLTNPFSRRIIVSAWNVADIDAMSVSGLPPCHMTMQFNVSERYGKKHLDLLVYIRSWDLFLGGPFNIAQYALLLHCMARDVNMEPNELIISAGNVHVYSNHFKQVDEQLIRSRRKPPALDLAPSDRPYTDKGGLTIDMIRVIDYDPAPAIPAPVAV